MRTFLYATLSLLISLSAKADILSVHCPLGCPSNPEGNDLVFSHVYALSNNPETKFADWVAYEVDVINFGDSPGRKWKEEPLLSKNETLEEEDFKGIFSSELKSDKGHQAPLAAFAGSPYWSELNYTSNITPQDSDLNQGPWEKLEAAVRNAVSYRKSLFVLTGPLYRSDRPSMPNADEKHIVPSAYFKIVYDTSSNAAVFIMEQSSKRNDDYCQKRGTLESITESTVFDLPELDVNSSVYARLGC